MDKWRQRVPSPNATSVVFTPSNGKITSMVFKAFYYYHFCPLQSISCISKVVIKRNVLIPENHGHPDDTKQTKKRGIHSWLTRTHQLAPCCHVGWGHTKKTQMIALILTKKNLSGLAGSYFQLRSDFQQHCPDKVTTLGTSGLASNTHVMMLIYIFTSTRTHWTLCWGWDYLFFYRFSKISHALFFFFLHRHVLTLNNCSYLCASKETCN